MLIRLPTILLIHHHQRNSVFWQGITCTADVFVQWSIRIPRLRSYTTVSDRLFEESNKPSVSVLGWVQICAEYDSYENKHLMYMCISIQGICSLLVFFFCSDKLQEYQCCFIHAWCWIFRPSLRSSRPCCSASASFMLLFRRAKSL